MRLAAAVLLLVAALPTLARAQVPAHIRPGDVRGDVPGDTLRVLTLNLWHDQRDWPARLAWLVDEARRLRPDVLLLQEVLQHERLENQATALGRALGLPHVHFVSADSAHRVRRYGNAIVSRLPFDTTAAVRLRPLDQYRTAAFARVRVNGRPVRLYTTHLHHEPDEAGGGIRAMQLHHLLAFLEATGPDALDAPLVLGGDFNAVPDASELRLLAPLRDVAAAFGAAAPTWGEAYAQGTPRRIDYVWDARDPRLVPVAASVALHRADASGRWPSDHFGVFAAFLVR